jgi:hypothetical protein
MVCFQVVHAQNPLILACATFYDIVVCCKHRYFTQTVILSVGILLC